METVLIADSPRLCSFIIMNWHLKHVLCFVTHGFIKHCQEITWWKKRLERFGIKIDETANWLLMKRNILWTRRWHEKHKMLQFLPHGTSILSRKNSIKTEFTVKWMQATNVNSNWNQVLVKTWWWQFQLPLKVNQNYVNFNCLIRDVNYN